MTDRELFEKALEALEEINKLSIGENAICLPAEIDEAMDALRERLAQPEPIIDKSAAIRIATALGWEPPREKQEQEPVAKWDASAPLVVTPHPAFQATQQRREWVGLTDEEKKDALVSVDAETKRLPPGFRDFASAIEAKLKEKNNG